MILYPPVRVKRQQLQGPHFVSAAGRTLDQVRTQFSVMRARTAVQYLEALPFDGLVNTLLVF
jgi:hypothetical protein